VAFGVHGLSAAGVSEANMPAFHDKLSRAEALRVVDYVRTLTPEVVAYDVHEEPVEP
jgi:mono/diheme cytochrome c family protein